MPWLGQLTRRLRRQRPLQDLAVTLMYSVVKVVAALPSRWVLKAGDALGSLMSVLDRRGRRIALQNMQVAFGDSMTRREKLRTLRKSLQGVVRSMLLLLHVQPLTPERYRKWVVLPDVEDRWQTRLLRERGGVLVSGHIGNWELLLGLRTLFQHFPPSVFLAEAIPHQAVNRVLKKLRSHGDLMSALRKGGARAVIQVVSKGGSAGLLVDRNVRRQVGGIWAPFFGLLARTTPLPAWLVERSDVPLFPIFCFPQDDGRYRIWLGPNLADGLTGEDGPARTRELLTRINAVLEEVIRARPELWNWTLKRFKSRSTLELGRYPPYSIFDPDEAPKPEEG